MLSALLADLLFIDDSAIVCMQTSDGISLHDETIVSKHGNCICHNNHITCHAHAIFGHGAGAHDSLNYDVMDILKIAAPSL